MVVVVVVIVVVFIVLYCIVLYCIVFLIQTLCVIFVGAVSVIGLLAVDVAYKNKELN
jgi:hypothetical protein